MSGFVLKMIAVVIMIIDHTGLFFFPEAIWLRAIGRIGFPIFAYFIAEGFMYTRSRTKYFLRIFILGLICQLVYGFVGDFKTMCILVTFSCSLILMEIGERTVKTYKERKSTAFSLYILLLLTLLFGFYVFCQYFSVDYGFAGILTPFLVSLFKSKPGKLAAMGFAILLITVEVYLAIFSWIQLYAFLSIPLIALYNGKPGRYRMKYFFYLFYPLHLAALWIISWLIFLF